jgi:hypothetical protein
VVQGRGGCGCGLGFGDLRNFFNVLKVNVTFMFFKSLLIFLMCGEECVKVAHFVSVRGALRCVVGFVFCVYWNGHYHQTFSPTTLLITRLQPIDSL